MIVRIMGDNQYRIADGHNGEIARLDEELLAAMDAGNNGRFTAALAQLTGYVRSNGEVVPDAELVPSDVMVPAADMTLAEARERLEGATVAADDAGEAGGAAGE
jgi:hypothetical protein